MVRVYLRKLAYLQQDAEHAVEGLARGAGSAHGAGVDLPDGGTAPEGAITLPPGAADPLALFASAGGGDLFPTFESDLLSDGLGVGRGGALFSGATDSLTVAEDISGAPPPPPPPPPTAHPPAHTHIPPGCSCCLLRRDAGLSLTSAVAACRCHSLAQTLPGLRRRAVWVQVERAR